MTCRPGEAQNSEVPPLPNSSNKVKARKIGFTHCNGAPAYANVITPATMDVHEGARSGAFSLGSMLCNIPCMIKFLEQGVGMSYTLFSCKQGGPDTVGKICIVYLLSKPMLGACNLVNLLLMIRILDIVLQQAGVEVQNRLVPRGQVHASAKGIFKAFNLSCAESPTFNLYSMGRATGGWWLGLVAEKIMEKFITLMNHSLSVARKFYWPRQVCKFLFRDTEFSLLARPNAATLACDVDDIVLPVEDGARRIVQQHADALGRANPEFKAYFEQMRDCHAQRGDTELSLHDTLTALEHLLQPGNPLAPFSIAGYNITTAVRAITPHFFAGFKLQEHKDSLLNRVHAQRDAFVLEWRKKKPIGWSNVADQWIDFNRATRTVLPMQLLMQPAVGEEPLSDESHTDHFTAASGAQQMIPSNFASLQQTCIQTAVQAAVGSCIQALLPALQAASQPAMQQASLQAAIQASIAASLAVPAEAAIAQPAIPLSQPASSQPELAPDLALPPAEQRDQPEISLPEPAVATQKSSKKRQARPADAKPAKKVKPVPASKVAAVRAGSIKGAKAAKVRAITPRLVDTCDLCCIPGRGDDGKPEPWFFLLQSPAKLPEDREGVMYFPATIVAPSLAELAQTKDGFAAKLYEGDAEIVKDSQCTIVQFVVVGDTVVISNDEMKRASDFVLECTMGA